MTENNNNTEEKQDVNHNTEVALAALKRLCTSFEHIASTRAMYADQEHMIDFDFQIRVVAANSNQKMDGILKQMYIYRLMKKSETFKMMFLSSRSKDL